MLISYSEGTRAHSQKLVTISYDFFGNVQFTNWASPTSTGAQGSSAPF